LLLKVVGNKAYVEFRGEATQLNGKPYNNQYIWVMIFDDQGHAQEIREYLDTRLVQEVFTNN
jgi:ketosteroid isomerase-like protein